MAIDPEAAKNNPERVAPSEQAVEQVPSQPEKTPEVVSAPETQVEAQPAPQEDAEQAAQMQDEAAQDAAMVATRKAPAVHKHEDRLEEEIEDILEEDLGDIYKAMPPDKKEKFKEEGEETVSKIREVTRKPKVNSKKIFGLIKRWLRIIPGVSRFFLEQEAKIKTDKILLVTEEEKKRNKNEL
jgi:DNA polymerase II large subunit